ncbi:MAG: hypothetical protein M3O70_02505 [Actinomycetota bacterium]|nr:hypothetical protein [Actinomycetota bacterium]
MSVDWSNADSIAEHAIQVEFERDELKARLEKLDAAIATQGVKNEYPELRTHYSEDENLTVAEKIAIAEARNDWALVGKYKDELLWAQTVDASAAQELIEFDGSELGARDDEGNLLPLREQIARAEAEGDWQRSGMLKDQLIKAQAEETMRQLAASQGMTTIQEADEAASAAVSAEDVGEDGESVGSQNVQAVDEFIGKWRDQTNQPLDIQTVWARAGMAPNPRMKPLGNV